MAGFLGLLAAAEAASPFDGSYQLYSSTRVNQTFVSHGGDMGYCPERRPSPLIVAEGRARYTTETGRHIEASLAPNGGFETRSADVDGTGALRVVGAIDGSGTVRVRQVGNACSYDFVWQKQS
jgi:hypothetical protein